MHYLASIVSLSHIAVCYLFVRIQFPIAESSSLSGLGLHFRHSGHNAHSISHSAFNSNALLHANCVQCACALQFGIEFVKKGSDKFLFPVAFVRSEGRAKRSVVLFVHLKLFSATNCNWTRVGPAGDIYSSRMFEFQLNGEFFKVANQRGELPRCLRWIGCSLKRAKWWPFDARVAASGWRLMCPNKGDNAGSLSQIILLFSTFHCSRIVNTMACASIEKHSISIRFKWKSKEKCQ